MWERERGKREGRGERGTAGVCKEDTRQREGDPGHKLVDWVLTSDIQTETKLFSIFRLTYKFRKFKIKMPFYLEK